MRAVPPDLLAFANHLADIAGAIIRAHADRPPEVETKSDGSPVTTIDKAVEAAIRAEILKTHPDHGIHGEEFPPHQPGAAHVWIIDPIDGTKEWVQGLPLYGVLLALLHGEDIVLGLADQPALRHRWLGATGHGTTRNGTTIRTRQGRTLDDAIVSTMGYDTFAHEHHAKLAKLRVNHRNTVTADSFYVFGLLAEGRVDLIASAHFALHDYAALDAIVRNAGGTVTDWSGAPLGRHSNGTILAAATPALHAAALAVLAT